MYCWRAEYTPDTTFYSASSHTNATTECFTTVVQASQTDTASTPSANNVVPGTSVSDTATVTPVVSGQPVPTGSVKFFLCQPAAVTAGQGCVSGGDQVGAAKTLSGGMATSDSTTNTSTLGMYCWRAEYTPDTTFYSASSHTNATTECFTTKQLTPTTTTQSSPNTSTVVPGTPASDTATISGGAGNPVPTGSVTFFLCQPSDVTAAGCPTGSGTQVGAVKTLSGGVATSDATTPASVTTAVGKYCWRTLYSGDTVYTSQNATNATIGTNGECFTVVNNQVNIVPTQATCQTFQAGTAGDLTTLQYGVQGTNINNVSPGVFFYFDTVTATTAGTMTVKVAETITTAGIANTYLIPIQNQSTSQMHAYNLDCTNASNVTESIVNGQAVFTFTNVTVGQKFVVSVKYSPTALAGLAVPNPTSVHYDFSTFVNNVFVHKDADGVTLSPR
jgi:hypothetical protein